MDGRRQRTRSTEVRGRDGIYGKHFSLLIKNIGIDEVVIAARSPWQNPDVERLIGTIRRECLDLCVPKTPHCIRIEHLSAGSCRCLSPPHPRQRVQPTAVDVVTARCFVPGLVTFSAYPRI